MSNDGIRTQIVVPQTPTLIPTGTTTLQPSRRGKLFARLSERFGIDQEKLIQTLRDTVFKVRANEPPFTHEEMAAALVLAEKYDLDPFTNEIYLARASGRLLRMISIDGWIKIVTRHPQYAGEAKDPAFVWDEKTQKPFSCTVSLMRKDCANPVTRTAFYSEWHRDTPTWNSMASTMLLHKAYKLCARYAFGIAGVDDEDEAVAPYEPAPSTALPAELPQLAPPREPGQEG